MSLSNLSVAVFFGVVIILFAILMFRVMRSGGDQPTVRYDKESLDYIYDRAMNSANEKFIEEVIHRWNIEFGDDAKYHTLQQHLYSIQKWR